MSSYNNLPLIYSHPAISAAQQHPGDLVLAVLGSLLPVSITVLAQQYLSVGRYRFGFNIIGESHLVRVERDGATICQELLACVPLTPEVCQVYHPFHDLQPFQVKTEAYTAQVHFERLPASANALTEYLYQQPAAALEVAFPAVYDYTPVTRIWWDMTREGVHWRTLHIYPEADHITAVWSASSFWIANQH